MPYFLMLFLCGIPLLLMEVTVGQYTRRGPIAAMGKICPLFKGKCGSERENECVPIFIDSRSWGGSDDGSMKIPVVTMWSNTV